MNTHTHTAVDTANDNSLIILFSLESELISYTCRWGEYTNTHTHTFIHEHTPICVSFNNKDYTESR